jgi:hypothetical protein
MPEAAQRSAAVGPIRAFAGSALTVARLLARGKFVWPRDRVGERLRCEDGTTSSVFRETVLREVSHEPALLVVQFRLRLLGRRRLPHELFRAESIANTPLFAGFPGFRSKLWLCDDATGTYRGIYEWDRAERAVFYAETLSKLLRLVSVAGTVKYRVVAGTRREDFLRNPRSVTARAVPDASDTWWRLQDRTASA